MKGAFPFALRHYYPHMKPLDQAIWERFIISNPGFFESCDYDVPVGSPPAFSTVVTDSTGGDDVKLYAKKIDVVAFRGNKTYIIELKPAATAGALGQAIGYRALYIRDVDPSSNCTAMVITDVIARDMLEVANHMGVALLAA